MKRLSTDEYLKMEGFKDATDTLTIDDVATANATMAELLSALLVASGMPRKNALKIMSECLILDISFFKELDENVVLHHIESIAQLVISTYFAFINKGFDKGVATRFTINILKGKDLNNG